jgi:hypothetical protein
MAREHVPFDRSPSNLARAYVQSKRHDAKPISATRATLAIRTLLIDCSLSDRELLDLVARFAADDGLSVLNDDP